MKKLILFATIVLCLPAYADTNTGFTVMTTGNVSGGVVTTPALTLSGMSSGVMKIATTTGGAFTITMPPAAGGVIANAIAHPSAANGQAAGEACANMLAASGLPGGVVTSVANVVRQMGSGVTETATSTAFNAAVSSIRAALASGAVAPDMAKGLVAWLSAMRSAR